MAINLAPNWQKVVLLQLHIKFLNANAFNKHSIIEYIAKFGKRSYHIRRPFFYEFQWMLSHTRKKKINWDVNTCLKHAKNQK